jgi:hypothetical protein
VDRSYDIELVYSTERPSGYPTWELRMAGTVVRDFFDTSGAYEGNPFKAFKRLIGGDQS